MGERRYDLRFEVPASLSGFRGRVTLYDEFSTDRVELDAEGLTIESVRAGPSRLPFELDDAQHRLRVSGVPPSTPSLTIDFSGTPEVDRAVGLYRTPLGDGIALTTHMEPVLARRAFPCFDRPDAKAVFTVEVVAPPNLAVISNTPPAHEELLPDGRRSTRFVPTPPMSTYLLYVGIGPFEQFEGRFGGHRVIAATAPGQAAKVEPLLEVTGRALQFFEQYYGLPYPLPKMHLLGIPKFLAGAMENWGAIAGAESFLLQDERTSLLTRIASSTGMIHEVAHQWFGNLVTMRTWDDLWLNESFATFASYKARHALYPQWAAWEEFNSFQVATSMMIDAFPGTHPIHVVVSDPSRAPDYFDDISYGKGAAVLRMLEGYVGDAAFREGVSLYLREHQFGNAEAADLWNAMARASKTPVDRVMAEWILRPGYPVVRARAADGTLTLTQSRFSLLGTPAEPPWPIPLTLEVNGNRRPVLFEGPTLSVPIPADAHVRLSPGRTGFYRIRYEGSLADQQLRDYPRLGALDRWGALDDAQAFFLSGDLTLAEYLETLRRAVTETEPVIVTQVFDGLTWLHPIARKVPRWMELYREIFVAQNERLGLVARPGESPPTTALRDQVTRARVALDPTFARDLAAQYPNVAAQAPEVVEAVYMAYASLAGDAEYAQLRERLRTAPPGLEGRRIAGGLAFLRRDEWIGECLGLVGTGELQISPWMRLLLTTAWLNPARSEALWQFYVRDLERCLPALQTGGWTLALLFQYTIPLVGLSRPDEVRRWVASRSFPEGAEGIKKGLDMLDVYTKVLSRIPAVELRSGG